MTKTELRKEFVSQRLRLSEQEHAKLSHEVNRRLLNLIPRDVRYVHTFLPSLQKGELNLWPMIRIALHRGVKLCVPIVKPNREMLSSEYTMDTKLHERSFGVLEPEEPSFIDESQIDVVLVPLLAFDSNGYRVGYGGGYYDRFLSRIPNALKIGVSLFSAVESISDNDKYDIPLDLCVSPNGQHQWKRQKPMLKS